MNKRFMFSLFFFVLMNAKSVREITCSLLTDEYNVVFFLEGSVWASLLNFVFVPLC